MIFGFVPLEAGPLELGFHRGQTLLQGFQIRKNQADVTRDLLDAPAGQVELLAADVDPHVVQAHVHVRVPGQPESQNVEHYGLSLIGDRDIDVLKGNNVAEVIGLAIVTIGLHLYLRVDSPVRDRARCGRGRV